MAKRKYSRWHLLKRNSTNAPKQSANSIRERLKSLVLTSNPGTLTKFASSPPPLPGTCAREGHERKEVKYRTIDDITEEYLRDHPDEIDDYITELFERYAQDGDTATLFSSLRVISRVKGVTHTAETSGMTRKGVQKALSEDGHPKFESVNAILHALGYRLVPQKL